MYEELLKLRALAALNLNREEFVMAALRMLCELGFGRVRWYDVARDAALQRDVLVRTAEIPQQCPAPDFPVIEFDVSALAQAVALQEVEIEEKGWIAIPITAGDRVDAVIACDSARSEGLVSTETTSFLSLFGATIGASLALGSAEVIAETRERRRDLSYDDPDQFIGAIAEELGSMLDAANVAVFELKWTDATLVKIKEWSPLERSLRSFDEAYTVGQSLTGRAWNDGEMRHIISVSEVLGGRTTLRDRGLEGPMIGDTAAESVLFAVLGRLDRRYLIRLVNRHEQPGRPFLAEARVLKVLAADLSSEVDAALASQRSRNLQSLSALTAEGCAPKRFLEQLEPAMRDEGIDDFLIVCGHRDSSEPGLVSIRGNRLGERPIADIARVGSLLHAPRDGGAAVVPLAELKDDGASGGLSSALAAGGFSSVLVMSIRTGNTLGALLVPMAADAWAAGRHQAAGSPPCGQRTLSMLQSYAQLMGQVVEARNSTATANGATRAFGLLGHELRGPLAALGSAAEEAIVAAKRVIRDGRGADRVESREIDALHEELWQRQDEISATLEMAQLASESDGELQLHLRSVRLATIIEQAVEDVVSERHLERQPRTYNFDIRPSAAKLGSIVADAAILRQAFKNILRNAAKYSLPRERGEPMRIEIFGEAQAGFVGVKVRNWGFGIPEEKRDLIFEPWVRGEIVDHVKPIRGMGLGLYLARRMVSAHRGDIRFESKSTLDDARRTAALEGFETVFEVRIPRDLEPGTHVLRWVKAG